MQTNVCKKNKMNENAIVVRTGCSEDVPFVFALERAVFSDPWSESAVAAHTENAHLCFYIAEWAGERCGYLLGSLIPPEGEIYRVASLPTMRRRGIGDALCARFLSEAQDAYLEVRKSNLTAQKLYHGLGFIDLGVRKRYYEDNGEDALLLVCQDMPPVEEDFFEVEE